MNTLQKSLRYSKNSPITASEIIAFADDLLSADWQVGIGRTSGKYNLKSLGWSFEFNNRKGAIGLCSPRQKTIAISQSWFDGNMDKSHDWEDTLRHELAHAVDFEMRGTSDHSNIWKSVARQVLCDAQRTTGAFERGDSRYLIICPNCNKKQAAHKRRAPRTACGDCCRKYNNNRFTSEYVFQLVVNPTYGKANKVIAEEVVAEESATKKVIVTPTVDSKLSRQQQVEKLLNEGVTDRKQISTMLGLNYSYLTRLLKIIENSKS